jgi:Type II secretion system (T2SS), protein M subtype b
MKRLGWQLRQLAQAMGLPGWVGVALLFACALGWVLAASPLSAEADRLESSSAALERRLGARANAAEAPPSTPQQQLAEFRSRFTGERRIAASVGRLQAAAKRHGVQLDQAEFRFASEAGEPLLRYTIVLPVKAEYRALRRFVREALHELPGLAIEEVNLRRNDPKSNALEAQLRFVLFVNKAN